MPVKKLSHKVIQLISLFFVETTNDFSIFWYVFKKLANVLTHFLCFRVFPCKRETNEHQMNRRLVSHRIVKYQAVAVVFQAGFTLLVLIRSWLWICCISLYIRLIPTTLPGQKSWDFHRVKLTLTNSNFNIKSKSSGRKLHFHGDR